MRVKKLLKPGQETVAFAQKGNAKSSWVKEGTGNKKKKPVKCFGCGTEGKYQDTCDICNKKNKDDKKGETNAILTDDESQECVFVEDDVNHQQESNSLE